MLDYDQYMWCHLIPSNFVESLPSGQAMSVSILAIYSILL
jgi:hypothetical protein